MSTHAQLGVKFSDGSISGCYVHYDGATIMPRLRDFLERKTLTGLVLLIDSAQKVGGIRTFHSLPLNVLIGGNHTSVTELLCDDEPYIINENNWDEYNMGGCRYRYLVDYETGTIHSEAGHDNEVI